MTNRLTQFLLKKTMLLLGFFTIAIACSSDDARINNPYLRPISFSIDINTNLPEYNILLLPGNAVKVSNAGIKGILVVNTGTGIFAWEASDPNHVPNECSSMTLNGIEATCSCENNTYNLYTGQDKAQSLPYTLLPYRVSQNENIITVSN